MPDSFAFDLLVQKNKIFKMFSPFWPISGGGAIRDPGDFI